MSRRERLERKRERRLEWADKAAARSESELEAVDKLASQIPLGQPILVGHHSERHARRHAARIDSGMRRGIELKDKAKRHAEKADGIGRMLDKSIFSDDDDALERLRERLAELEAKRKRMRDANRLYRKRDADGLAKLGFNLDVLDKAVGELESWQRKQPFASYQLTNLGSRIRATKQRIAEIEHHEKQAKAAADAGGVLIRIVDTHAAVTFAEKPDRSVLSELKAAGFHWSKGSWNGTAAKLPECVRELADEAAS